MDQKWKIEFYKTTNNKSPVEDFILELDVNAQNKVVDMLALVKEFGINLSLPHAKKVIGTPLWELRILGKNNIKFFYIESLVKLFYSCMVSRRKNKKQIGMK